jgi:hypothetical protein
MACLISSIIYGPPYSVPYILWTPFDHKNNVLGFAIMLIYLTLSPLVVSGICVICDMLPIFFMAVVCGLYEELRENVDAIDTEMDMEMTQENKLFVNKIMKNHHPTTSEKLKKCIEDHKKILIIIKKTQNLFSTSIFTQIVASCIVMCTAAYSVSMVKN